MEKYFFGQVTVYLMTICMAGIFCFDRNVKDYLGSRSTL